MKKMLSLVSLLLVVVSFTLVLTGCGKNAKTLVGSWAHSSYVYTFNKDKTGTYDALGTKMEFTYEDDGSKVSILYKGNTNASSYEYKIEDNKLIIKDSFGNDVEYTRK